MTRKLSSTVASGEAIGASGRDTSKGTIRPSLGRSPPRRILAGVTCRLTNWREQAEFQRIGVEACNTSVRDWMH